MARIRRSASSGASSSLSSSSPSSSRFRLSSSAASSGPSSSSSRGTSNDVDIAAFNQYTGMRSLLNPLWCYHGFRVTVLLLTFFGVVMVFSSSVVSQVSQGGSPWGELLSQGQFCVLGLVLGFIAMRVPAAYYQRCGGAVVLFSMLLQFLTITSLGRGANGNTGWISVFGLFSMQPAEVMKFALCIWMPHAMMVGRERYKNSNFINAFGFPLAVFAGCIGLVLLGHDIGTCIVVGGVGVVAMLLGGFPWKYVLGTGLVLAMGFVGLVLMSPNRLNRVLATYGGCDASSMQGVCYQSLHARYAMASGGLLGVGIGNSKEKWNYLPEAHNDFIFAIIGEETGFIGAAMVMVLFVVLGWCLLWVARCSPNHYYASVLVSIMAWLIGQALMNIMVVIGFLPVIGVPMPFVSAGGSSLIMCLIASGTACSMMRAQPQIRAESSALGR